MYVHVDYEHTSLCRFLVLNPCAVGDRNALSVDKVTHVITKGVVVVQGCDDNLSYLL